MKYTKQIEEWIKSLEINQFNKFIELFSLEFSKNDIDLIQKVYSSKNMTFVTQDITKSTKIMENFYSEETDKIFFIINSNEILKKIGGLKIIVSGPTGTGKTTLINEIINKSKIPFIDINFINLISSKMGQTQINLLNLASEINEKNEKTILFIDEIDSIITNRKTSDLGEHSRIVATFLKFLDNLSSNIILFMATNYLDIIDSAILRRCQVNIKTSSFKIEKFIEIIKKEEFNITTQKSNFYINNIIEEKNQFTFSDVKYFLDECYLEQKMNKKNKIGWEFIYKKFKNKFEINYSGLSFRDKEKLGVV